MSGKVCADCGYAGYNVYWSELWQKWVCNVCAMNGLGL